MAVLVPNRFVSFITSYVVWNTAGVIATDRPWIEELITRAHRSALGMAIGKCPILSLAEAERGCVDVAHSRLATVRVARLKAVTGNGVVMACLSIVDHDAITVKRTWLCRIWTDEEWLGIGVTDSCKLTERWPPSWSANWVSNSSLAVGVVKPA